jgi:hypothetical protein
MIIFRLMHFDSHFCCYFVEQPLSAYAAVKIAFKQVFRFDLKNLYSILGFHLVASLRIRHPISLNVAYFLQ